MKTKSCCLFLLSLTCFVVFSQSEDEARRLMDQHRYRETLAVLQQLPDSREIILMRAKSYEEIFHFPAAVAEYEKLLAEQPDNLDMLILLADVTWRGGDADASLRYWTRINELSPDNLFFQTRKAVAHYRASDWQGTIDAAEIVFKQDSIPLLLRYVGDAYTALGNTESIFYYHEALNRNPADHHSVLRIGNIYYNIARGSTEEFASQFYNMAIEITDTFLENINPNHRQISQLKGMAYYSSGQFDRAIEQLNHNVALGDSSYTTTYFLGMSYYASRLFFDATTWLGKAYDSNNGDINLLYFYGNSLIRTGDRELGVAVLDEGIVWIMEQYGRMYDFELSIADAHLRSNRPSAAIEFYLSALSRRPDQHILLYTIATIYDQRMADEKQNALTFYERFMRTAPNDSALIVENPTRNNDDQAPISFFHHAAERRIRELREELFMSGGR